MATYQKGGYIEAQTQKTGHKVIIPLHAQLKEVLGKTGGLRHGEYRIGVLISILKRCARRAGISQEREDFLVNPKTRAQY